MHCVREPSVGFSGALKGISSKRRIQMETDVQSLFALSAAVKVGLVLLLVVAVCVGFRFVWRRYKNPDNL